jgi:hypothetical protein
MNVLFIISTDDAETVYNAMRLANVAVKKEDDVSVFMLGKGVLFEQISTNQFDVMDQVKQYESDFYVWGVCMKSHSLEGSSACPIAWMDDLYELSMDADKVITFWIIKSFKRNWAENTPNPYTQTLFARGNIMGKVKVAVVQAASVLFDKAASVEKACHLIKETGNEGANIVLLPEAFVPAYPRGFSFGMKIGSRSEEGRELWKRYWET